MTIPDDDDLLAGEYVLGTLDHSTRMAATLRRVSDTAFDAAVTQWEERLTPLIEAVGAVVPGPHLWPAILTRIGAGATVPVQSNVVQFERQLTRWKLATAASMALAAVLALWLSATAFVPRPAPGPTFVAVLQATNDTPAFVMRADLKDHDLVVRPVAAQAVPGKSYELWAIDPSLKAPKSLGLLGVSGPSKPVLADIPADVLARATYAVTIEPEGGSPTGGPTTAPILFGHLIRNDP